jgi:hypothetical protein
MLAGHIHSCKVLKKEEDDSHPCDVVTASRPIKGSEDIVCGSIVLSDNTAYVKFIDSQGEIHGEYTLPLKK